MKRIFRFLVVVIPLVLLVSTIGYQASWAQTRQATLTCAVPGDYPTIQDAVNEPLCTLIELSSNTFTETVIIDRSVTVQGQGPDQTMVDGNAANSVFTIQAGTSVTLTGMTIQNGDASYGGGIYNEGTLTVSDTTLSGNLAAYGGGIYNHFSILTVINSTFSDNTAYGGGGGISNSGVLTVTDSTLSGNSSEQQGGGGIENHAMLYVIHTTLSGNSSQQHGGGVDNWDTLSVIESTLSGNSADDDGGGIYNEGMLTVSDTTLSGNSAARYGGGILNYNMMEVKNSIIANSPIGGDCFNDFTITSLGTNLDSDGSCGLSGPGDLPNTDPLLGPLQDNGGPTWTYALLPGSPALDAGSCPGATVDQRGFSRPVDLPGLPNVDNGCDIGAYEAQDVDVCYVPEEYATIQAAVNDPWCPLVGVSAGTFAENVTIDRTVTIKGQGPDQTVVDGDAAGSVFTIQAGTTVTLTGITIQNGDTDNGAGIRNYGTLSVSHSTLNGNSAEVNGGGIANYANLHLDHSTLSGNTAYRGGGIRNYGPLKLTNSMLNGNTADFGGGISNFSSGSIEMKNSIIANSPSGNDCANGGTIISQDYNLDSDSSCNLTEPNDHPNTDPLLGPLQDNGGPTWTHALLPGSPALDAGSCPGATADQRGYPRPVDLPWIDNADDGCDIGAFEFQVQRLYLPILSK